MLDKARHIEKCVGEVGVFLAIEIYKGRILECDWCLLNIEIYKDKMFGKKIIAKL